MKGCYTACFYFMIHHTSTSNICSLMFNKSISIKKILLYSFLMGSLTGQHRRRCFLFDIAWIIQIVQVRSSPWVWGANFQTGSWFQHPWSRFAGIHDAAPIAELNAKPQKWTAKFLVKEILRIIDVSKLYFPHFAVKVFICIPFRSLYYWIVPIWRLVENLDWISFIPYQWPSIDQISGN